MPTSPPRIAVSSASASTSGENLRPRGADGAPHADLARALGHRHQHRVGDDDDGGDEGHQRDGQRRGADALRQPQHEGPRRLRGEDVEGVGRARSELAPRPHAARRRGSRPPSASPPAGARANTCSDAGRAEGPFVGAERHVDVAIERDAARLSLPAAPRRRRRSHGRRCGRAGRRRARRRKQRLRDVRADHRDLRRPPLLGLAEEAAVADLDDANVGQRGGGAVDRRVLEPAAAGDDVAATLRRRRRR